MPRRRACACAKRTFPSRGKAIAAVEVIRHGQHGERIPCRAYPCPTGHGWHLTAQDGDRAAVYADFFDARTA